MQAGAQPAGEWLRHHGIEGLATHHLTLDALPAVAGQALRLADDVRHRVGVHDPRAHDVLWDLSAFVERLVLAFSLVCQPRPLHLHHRRVELHPLRHRIALSQWRRRHRAQGFRGACLGGLRQLDVLEVGQVRAREIRVHLHVRWLNVECTTVTVASDFWLLDPVRGVSPQLRVFRRRRVVIHVQRVGAAFYCPSEEEWVLFLPPIAFLLVVHNNVWQGDVCGRHLAGVHARKANRCQDGHV